MREEERKRGIFMGRKQGDRGKEHAKCVSIRSGLPCVEQTGGGVKLKGKVRV